MKRLFIVVIGMIIAVLTGISELLFSVVHEDEWSNYTYSWGTQWSVPGNSRFIENALAENKIAISDNALLTNKN